MKTVHVTPLLKLCLAVCLICLFKTSPVPAAQQENYCFTCHTNPRKLIEITREVARTHSKKPGASAETKGEG